jgi:hypothetical protein
VHRPRRAFCFGKVWKSKTLTKWKTTWSGSYRVFQRYLRLSPAQRLYDRTTRRHPNPSKERTQQPLHQMLNWSPLLLSHGRVFQVRNLILIRWLGRPDRGSSRVPFIFYCLGSLDLLDTLGATKENERESWRNDIWGLQAGASVFSSVFLRP